MKFKTFWFSMLAQAALANPLSYKATGKSGRKSAKRKIKYCHDLNPAGTKLARRFEEKKIY